MLLCNDREGCASFPVQPTQKLAEQRSPRCAVNQPDCRRNERAENLFYTRSSFTSAAFGLLKQRKAFPVQWFKTPNYHGLEERFLGSEVIVNGSEIDLGRRRDGPQRRAGKTLIREQLFRDIENLLFGLVG